MTDRPEPEVPWIETPEGGLFFVNAVLAGPPLLALFPLALGKLLRLLGIVEGPSVLLDTIPTVAAHVAPWAGWVALVPLVTTAKNLAVARRPVVRLTLVFFLLLHVGVLVYTIFRLVGQEPA